MQRKRLIPILIFCLSGLTVTAQKKWDLRQLVDYAMTNNISVKLSEVQTKQAQLTYKQSKLSQFPTATIGSNAALNSGLNQDPTTFSRVTETYFSAGIQFQTTADIFNFYSRRNTIAANEWELQAAKANVDRLKNDIALTIANSYLQILLGAEQEKITQVQLQQTAAQLLNTKKLVDAGSLPPLNLTQLEAQLAVDSGNYITARGNVIQSKLVLKAYLGMEADIPFDVTIPPVESIPLDPIADLQPENVYKLAIENQPLQRFNELKLRAAEKNKAAAKGAMYPTFSVFGNLSSNYLAFKKRPIYGIADYSNSGLIVSPGPGIIYDVKAPVFGGPVLGYRRPNSVGTQITDNFRQTVGLNFSVPLFNGHALRTNYERSKLNIESLTYQKQLDNQTLKQNIFQAYNAVLIALEKYNASKKSVSASEQTFDYAKKRFDVGMLGTFDLLTTQNNLLRAKLEYSINLFDYVFKMKVLEFYKGQGIKL